MMKAWQITALEILFFLVMALALVLFYAFVLCPLLPASCFTCDVVKGYCW
jgi:hypothetical protein